MNRTTKLMLGPMLLIATAGAALAEPLDRRYGPDRERGYRAEREFDESDRDFKNRDRANFLKMPPTADAEPEIPRPDLHHSPAIGKQK